MKNLDERIYELLEKNGKSISINEIVGTLANVKKQDVTKELQNLKRQGVIFRSIKEGKAFYSINSNDGEGRTGIQENINNINNIFTAFGNKQTLNNMNLVNQIDEALGLTEETKVLEDVDFLNELKIGFIDFDLSELKYDKHVSFENDSYKMEIPDSFKYLTNVEDRDFVAYLPKKDATDLSYDEGGANIIIYSSALIPMSGEKRIAELKRLLYDLVFYNGGYLMFERYGGKPEYKVVELACGRTGVIYMKFDTIHNFYFLCCLKNNFKQMRVAIDSINGSKEDLEKLAISIMNKFSVKEQLNDFFELNDKKYLIKDIEKELVSNWVDNIKGIHRSLNAYFQVFTKLESTKINFLKSKGTFNIVKFKTEIRDGLKEYISIIEKYMKNAEEFILNARKNNVDNDLMIPAYYCFYQFLKQEEFSINLEDGSQIVEKSNLSKTLRDKIFDTETCKLIDSYSDKDYFSDNNNNNNNNSDTSLKESDELKECCDDFIRQSKKILNRHRRDWSNTQEDYIDGLSSRTIESEYELKWEIKNIKQVARTFGDQYDDFITELDKEGKKLLKQGANYKFIEEVIKIIDETFEAIDDLSLSFNAGGLAYLNLGSFDYEISDDLRNIKYWWKKEYDHNPEVIEIRDKANKEKELQKRKEEEKVSAWLSEIEKEITSESQIWESEIKNIQIKFEEDKKKLENAIESLQKKQLDELLHDKKEIINALNTKIEELKKKNKEYEAEISSLSFLKFMQKDKLKMQIDINEQNIEKYRESIKLVNNDYKKEYEKVLKELEEIFNTRKKKMENEYKYPNKPKDVYDKLSSLLKLSNRLPIDNGQYITKIQKENNEVMEVIYNELLNLARPVTITELQSSNFRLNQMSNQKISALLFRLVEAKCVTRIIDKKKSYFTVGDESFNLNFSQSENTDLVDKELNNTYSKDRNKLFNLLKGGKLFNVNEKDQYEQTRNMSKLRLYQILFSLEEDGLIKKDLNNGGIIFRIK